VLQIVERLDARVEGLVRHLAGRGGDDLDARRVERSGIHLDVGHDDDHAGRGHFRGSSPRSPAPRVTISRMYPSSLRFSRPVRRPASAISTWSSGIWSAIARAESYSRSR